MKSQNWRSVLVLVGALLQPLSPHLLAAARSPTPNTQSFQLNNGLKVVVLENHRSPSVVSILWYKVGGSYEPQGLTGISHVLEHMMFKGTNEVPRDKFATTMARFGITINAFTTEDFTGYYEFTNKNYLPLTLSLEADRMTHLSLPAPAYNKEIQVVKEERRMRTDNSPIGLLLERFQAVAYLASNYKNPVVGWPADLNNITIQDVRNWYHKWYAPNNAILVLAGDITLNKARSLAQQYFGHIPARPLPRVLPLTKEIAPGQRRLVVYSALTNVPLLLMGYKVPVMNTATRKSDVYALEVLSALFSSGSGSRLNERLVRTTQVAADASAQYNPFARSDTLFVLSGIPNVEKGKQSKTLEQALRNEINQLKNNPPSPQEMKRAITTLEANFTYKQDSLMNEAMGLGALEVVGLPWQLRDANLAGIKKVTPAEIQEVVRTYFHASSLTTATLFPQPKS